MFFNQFLKPNAAYLQYMIFQLIFVSYMLLCFVDGEPASQEKSILKYSNPKYLENVQLITYRRKRSDPLSTNVTATLLHAWGNNVTMVISYPVEDGTTFKMSARICDLANKIWVVETFRQHSNITDCPQPAGTYAVYNIPRLPKSIPSPIPITKKSSSGFVNVLYYISDTKEKIIEIKLLVKVK